MVIAPPITVAIISVRMTRFSVPPIKDKQVNGCPAIGTLGSVAVVGVYEWFLQSILVGTDHAFTTLVKHWNKPLKFIPPRIRDRKGDGGSV
jgi:hypothetical protein